MTEARILSTVYEPKQVEERWYQYWLDGRYFHGDVEHEKQPYSIVIPPPNVTGSLHMGHALNNTLQDILIRWRRMAGDNVTWIPGTDHAGIATQVVVEKQLAKEGLTRHDLGREAFIERVWDWKEKYGSTIIKQLQRLGTSCDWERERFTMDESCSKAVRTVFVNLYQKGLIYQGDFIINWCPRCLTALSDLEVEHEDIVGRLHYVKYPIHDSDEYIMVATTRPETILGDTAVAVHPEDKRYQHLIGKSAILPIIGRELPIIADDYVDPAFGTGAVKVTPAHDPNDFEIGKRHHLPNVIVINENAEMTELAGTFAGMDRYECRKAILAALDDMGLLVKIEDNPHAVGHCSRCDTAIEPLLSRQWFVKMKPLADPAMHAVEEGRIRFVPERFKNTYMYWLENIHDWCISRQLWWGHRIPAWYCDECQHITVSMEDPTTCEQCGHTSIHQDPDVLDTWFSSALWPFSTLGWPDATPELSHFYPTSVLVTGYDIIFFWVARMIFMGLEFMDETPFYEVFINGLIRDAEGKKMSKSRGNTIDPLDIIDQYGTDTLRFTLVTGSTPGNDIRLFPEKFEGTRNFANKIWNASRFVLMNLDNDDFTLVDWTEESLTLADRWIISRSHEVTGEVERLLKRYDIGEAGRELYDFIWNEFCDWYIEIVKPRLYDQGNPRDRHLVQNILWRVLSRTLSLLHPFMPFITEEIWQCLPHQGESIMISPWPAVNPKRIDAQAVADMGQIMEIIKTIRNMRAEMNINLGQKMKVEIHCGTLELVQVLEENRNIIVKLAGLGELKIVSTSAEKPDHALTAIAGGVEIYLPQAGLIDKDKEISRLEKELVVAQSELERVVQKLKSSGFLEKAPPEIIAKEREKEGKNRDTVKKIEERIHQIRQL